MTIDNKLKFNKHVENLCIVAVSQLNVLNRFRGIFDINEKGHLVLYSYFQISTNCPIIWHFYDKTTLTKILTKEPYDL